MRMMMIIGGLSGFTIGISFGLAASSAWHLILWRSSLAALGAGLLLRWWGQVWTRSLQEADLERAEKLEAAKSAHSQA